MAKKKQKKNPFMNTLKNWGKGDVINNEIHTNEKIAEAKNLQNKTSNIPAVPNRCSPIEKNQGHPKYQLPDSDPFKMFCYSEQERNLVG